MTTSPAPKPTLQIAALGDREIVMTRVFNAPAHLVFDALTKPELVKRWLLGPDGWTMPVCEIDLKVGGAYRYVWQRASTSKQMGSRGVFREIVVPKRLVFTELFDEAWYHGESVITCILAEQGGKTTLTSTMQYGSQDTRDAVLKSGMEGGVAVSYDRLAAIVEKP
jgi:uncharacterized protein YndB with AHSA1/START domain